MRLWPAFSGEKFSFFYPKNGDSSRSPPKFRRTCTAYIFVEEYLIEKSKYSPILKIEAVRYSEAL
jgi:hypothetical protein